MRVQCHPVDKQPFGCSCAQALSQQVDDLRIAGTGEGNTAAALVAQHPVDVLDEKYFVKVEGRVPVIAIKEATTEAVSGDAAVTMLLENSRQAVCGR